MKIYNPTGFSSNLTGSFSGSVKGIFEGSFTGSALTDISGAFDSISSSLAAGKLNNTTDTLDGDLTVTGTLTAQDLLVQEVTSSIVFSSGSNKFGSLTSDTQSFTGSLQVSGSVELEDNVRIKVGSSDDLQIYHDSSNSYINETGNGSLITQASDYFLRVGGTNNTNNALTVANSGQVTLFHANNTKLNTTSTGVTVTGDITANALYDKDDSSYYLNLSDSGASLVTSGSIGIGTTSPSSLLHLYKSSGDTMINIQAVSAGDPGITFTSINNRTGNIFYSDGSTNAKLTYDHNDVSFKLYAHNTSTEDFVLNETTAYFPTQNVGIGETQPDSKLHVKGDMVTIEDPSGGYKMELSADSDPVTIMSDNLTGVAYGQIAFLAGNGSGTNDITRMLINSSGNVGIGSASPSSTLDVQTNSSAGVARISADGNGAVYSANGDVQLYTNDAAYSTSIYAANKGSLLFRVQNDGNTGIGTGSPSAKLHLYVNSANDDTFHIFNGSVRTHLLGSESSNGVMYMRSSSNSNTVRINASGYSYFNGGNVGIGTTSPQAKLDVDGNNYLDATTTKVFISDHGNNYDNGDEAARIQFRSRYWSGDDNLGASNSSIIHYKGQSNGYGGSDLGFTTSAIDGVQYERLRIFSSGNVGIGTNSAEQKLHVEGRGIFDSGVSSDIIQFRNDNGGFVIGNTTNLASIDLASGQAIRIRQGSSVPFTLTTGGDLTLANNLYLINTKTRISSDANGEVGINYSVSNTSTYSLSVYEGSTRKFGVRKDGNLYIYPGAFYSQQYTYTSSWASSFQTVVPNGTLAGNRTYLIQVWTNSFGTPPYYASAGWIFNTSAGTNGNGQSNTIDVATATHVSSNAYWQYNITTAQNSSNGIAVKLVNGPSVSSIALFVRVTEISDF